MVESKKQLVCIQYVVATCQDLEIRDDRSKKKEKSKNKTTHNLVGIVS